MKFTYVLVGALALGAVGCATQPNAEFCCTSPEGCSRSGVLEPRGCASGLTCVDEINTCVVEGCGDGAIVFGETCDDGNNVNGDGCSADCRNATCYVPVTHTSISDAVADQACVTVFVHSGTYDENVTVARDVSVIGVGADPVVVDGGARDSVFRIVTDTATLENLIIRNGRAPQGGGIHTVGDLTLRGAQVEDNVASGPAALGGGIYSEGSALTIHRSAVARNKAVSSHQSSGEHRASGGGIHSTLGKVEIHTSEIHSNSVGLVDGERDPSLRFTAAGGGVSAEQGEVHITSTVVSKNTIDVNAEPGSANVLGGGVYASRGPLLLSASSVTLNTALVKGGRLTARGGGLFASSLKTSESHIDANELRTFGYDDVTGEGAGAYIIGVRDSEITQSTFSGNRLSVACLSEGAEATGGGLAIAGTAVTRISDTRILNNVVEAIGVEHVASGGGLAWLPTTGSTSAGVTVVRSSIMSAEVKAFGARGGGVYSVLGPGQKLSVRQSTISSNRITAVEAALGGGVYALSSELINVTISNNRLDVPAQFATSALGGGLFGDRLNSYSSTFFANVAGVGGGVHIVNGNAANTVFAHNVGVSRDCKGVLRSSFNNLFTSLDGCTIEFGNRVLTTDALMDSLADNGGATPTHALKDGSPAIDAGTPTGCNGPIGLLDVDQRDRPRTVNGRCDIGAYEK